MGPRSRAAVVNKRSTSCSLATSPPMAMARPPAASISRTTAERGGLVALVVHCNCVPPGCAQFGHGSANASAPASYNQCPLILQGRLLRTNLDSRIRKLPQLAKCGQMWATRWKIPTQPSAGATRRPQLADWARYQAHTDKLPTCNRQCARATPTRWFRAASRSRRRRRG